MTITSPKTYYVYTYAFPDGTVFYVGKGCNARIDEHEHEARRGCDCKKCYTIRQIWHSGKVILPWRYLLARVYHLSVENVYWCRDNRSEKKP